MTLVSHILWTLFPWFRVSIHFAMGYILGDFFTNSSGHSGANPTIASYNASVANFYNATGSLARFES
jgi:hypothetical protein